MGCLMLGTEDGHLLVLDPSGTKAMHSWKAGGVPAFLTVTGMGHSSHVQLEGWGCCCLPDSHRFETMSVMPSGAKVMHSGRLELFLPS